jgi:hypothetical protein
MFYCRFLSLGFLRYKEESKSPDFSVLPEGWPSVSSELYSELTNSHSTDCADLEELFELDTEPTNPEFPYLLPS